MPIYLFFCCFLEPVKTRPARPRGKKKLKWKFPVITVQSRVCSLCTACGSIPWVRQSFLFLKHWPHFVTGIKCDAPCKNWLERGQCSTKWRRRCLRTCLALGCDDEPVKPEGKIVFTVISTIWNSQKEHWGLPITRRRITLKRRGRGARVWDLSDKHGFVFPYDHKLAGVVLWESLSAFITDQLI